MTITELQKELQEMYEKYGDIEVVVEDTDWNRSQEIIEAASDLNIVDGRADFYAGAIWADNHPVSSLTVKVWNLATKTAIAQINKEMPYFKSENEIERL